VGRFHFKRKDAEKKNPMPAGTLTEKERLFDLMIHDLTGPLSVISVSASNLLRNTDRSGPLTERQKSGLDRILRNVGKAQDILREMVEILRSEAGLFRKEPFLVENTLQESILDVLEVESQGAAEMLRREKDTKRFRELLEPHGIFVEITGKFRESPFCHDPRKVRYILRNLVSNAVKYRRERVNVSIRGDVNLLVSVEDDGRGIPKGEQEAVFERFVRLKGKEATLYAWAWPRSLERESLGGGDGGHYFITKRGGYRDTIFGRYSSPAITRSRRRSSRASTCATLDL